MRNSEPFCHETFCFQFKLRFQANLSLQLKLNRCMKRIVEKRIPSIDTNYVKKTLTDDKNTIKLTKTTKEYFVSNQRHI